MGGDARKSIYDCVIVFKCKEKGLLLMRELVIAIGRGNWNYRVNDWFYDRVDLRVNDLSLRNGILCDNYGKLDSLLCERGFELSIDDLVGRTYIETEE